MNFAVLASILLLLIGSPWVSAEESASQVNPKYESKFPELPKGFRIGVEMELYPKALGRISGLFDFDRLQRKYSKQVKLKEGFLGDYLRGHPSALSSLPPGLRAELTAGLKLENAWDLSETSSGLIHRPSQGIQIQGVQKTALDPKTGLPMFKLPSLKAVGEASPVNAPRLILPKKPEVPRGFEEQTDGVLLRKGGDWEILYARWQALPEEIKERHVRWEFFTPERKAELLLTAFARANEKPLILGNDVHLKKSFPMGGIGGLTESDLEFLKRFRWYREGGVFEFNHLEEVEVRSLDEFFQDVARLARLAGIEMKILRPEETQLREGNLHYHVSVKGRSLKPFAKRWNRLLLARRVSLGILNDLKGKGDYLYQRALSEKGLVRLVEDDRFEVRAHHQPLKKDLTLLAEVLGLPEEKGLERLDQAIRKELTDETLERFSRVGPSFLDDLNPYLTEAQRKRWFEPYLRELEAIASLKITPAWGEKDWALLDRAIQGSDVPRAEQAIAVALSRDEWPDSFMARIIEYVGRERKEITEISEEILEMLAEQPRIPKAFWPRVPELIRQYGEHGSNMSSLTVIIARQKTWPDEVWKGISELIENEGHTSSVRRKALEALDVSPEWPEGTWRSLFKVLEDPGSDRGVVDTMAGVIGMRKQKPPASLQSRWIALSKAGGPLAGETGAARCMLRRLIERLQ